MRPAALADLCCPACGGVLRIGEPIQQGNGIIEGSLHCSTCSAAYPIQKGIPHLLSLDEAQPSVAQEMEGWVSLWERRGMYERPALQDSFDLPYRGGVWADVAPMFDLALQEMELQGNEVILDLGAGQGWAARHFAERGCKVYAVDIVADDWYGLGRAWAIMQHADVYFEPVLADGEALPFFEARFDIVFMCGALHHFASFDQVLRQIHRVLKPGGRLIATGEPAMPVTVREGDVQEALEEVEEGITERRPKTFQYWLALRRAGFRAVGMDTLETHDASSREISDWIDSTGQAVYEAARPVRKRFARLIFRILQIPPHKLAKEVTLQLFGGNLLITATKP